MTETRAPAETIRAPVIPRPGMAKDWETWAEQVSKVLEDHLDQLARKLNSIDTEVLIRDVDADLTNQGNALWGVETNTLPAQLQDIRQRIEDVAATHATETANIYDTVDEHKVEFTDNNTKAFAAIIQEALLRVTADDAQALVSVGLRADLTNLQTSVSGTSTAVQSLEARVTNIDGTLTSQAQSIIDLQSSVADANLGITANAQATQTLTTRVTNHDGKWETQAQTNSYFQANIEYIFGIYNNAVTVINQQGATITAHEGIITAHGNSITALQATIGQKAEASAVQSLDVYARVDLAGQVNAIASAQTSLTSTVNGHTANLTQLAQSVDGIALQWVLTGTIDSTTGGLRFQGARQAGGGVTYKLTIDANVDIHGDLIVTGSTPWQALAAGAGGKIYFDGPNNQGASVIVEGRGNDIFIQGIYEGDWLTPVTSPAGNIYMYRDGILLRQKTVQWVEDVRPAAGTFWTQIETSLIVRDNPGYGTHTYAFVADLARPCTILVIVPS